MTGIAPFMVLHVCTGNICRSPMAERILRSQVRDELGPVADEWLHSHGAGTDSWHEGEPMNSPAARELRSRGIDPDGFRARTLRPEQLSHSDLVLTATYGHRTAVVEMMPDMAPKTFVLGEFARLASTVDSAALPPFAPSIEAFVTRARALVEAADSIRAGAEPLPSDDLDDPWSRGAVFFSKTADQIADSLAPLVAVLAGHPAPYSESR